METSCLSVCLAVRMFYLRDHRTNNDEAQIERQHFSEKLLLIKKLAHNIKHSHPRINNSSFCICDFHMILAVNSDYFLKQR
jgi:hypothetical protein